MSEVPLYRPRATPARDRKLSSYGGTPLIRKRASQGPYRRPTPRILGGSQGGGYFLMGEVPVYGGTSLIWRHIRGGILFTVGSHLGPCSGPWDGGRRLLMSEVPLYTHYPSSSHWVIQGYLTHKKQRPPRTLQWTNV